MNSETTEAPGCGRGMKRLEIFGRLVYGQQKIYPANETALKFAQLLGVRTFNAAQLRQIEALDFQVEQVIDPALELKGAA